MGISKAMMEKVAIAKGRSLGADAHTIICCTRYGNVLGSRGSVIPLWIDQIKAGEDITITDPNMTRFMMTLEGAVELVLFAFQYGQNGDLFVQKAPAATIKDLAEVMIEIFNAKNKIQLIGTRHGEKLYESLLTDEECLVAEDLGNYYRVRPDDRDLNYGKYFSEGVKRDNGFIHYNSHNAHRLSKDELKKMLLDLPYIQEELKKW